MAKPITATLFAALPLFFAVLAPAQSSPFAARVIDFQPAPGQFVNHPLFVDPAAALGAPVGGGTLAADNSKVVSLGGFGGSISLAFDHTVVNKPPHPSLNPRGLDLIIFSNAFWVGSQARRWGEAGVIEVSRDANGNGRADDPWFVIPGSHLPSGTPPTRMNVTWDATDPAFPPTNKDWVPPGRTGRWTTSAFALPTSTFAGPVIGPTGPAPALEAFFGYADVSPTLLLGDTNADNQVDELLLAAEFFYTRPDDPFATGITFGSGGGDAIDLDWAVDPATGQPAALVGIDFVRITTAVNNVNSLFGENSVEISGVAEVLLATGTDYNRDGVIDQEDLSGYITAFLGSDLSADFNWDRELNQEDLSGFITAYLAQ